MTRLTNMLSFQPCTGTDGTYYDLLSLGARGVPPYEPGDGKPLLHRPHRPSTLPKNLWWNDRRIGEDRNRRRRAMEQVTECLFRVIRSARYELGLARWRYLGGGTQGWKHR